jgi:hypothetical protein
MDTATLGGRALPAAGIVSGVAALADGRLVIACTLYPHPAPHSNESRSDAMWCWHEGFRQAACLGRRVFLRHALVGGRD